MPGWFLFKASHHPVSDILLLAISSGFLNKYSPIISICYNYFDFCGTCAGIPTTVPRGCFL